MADPRFYRNAGPFSAARLAELTGSEVSGDDPDREFHDVAPLQNASADQVSFIDNPKYLDAFRVTEAGAVVVHPDRKDMAPKGCLLLLNSDPYRAYAIIASTFYPDEIDEASIAPGAHIHPTARVADGCRVDSGAVIGAGAVIGPGGWIGANSVIGDAVEIGAKARIGANVTISHAIIGNAVRILPGTCIGQDGFGYAMGAKGHQKVPQLGRVMIGDGTEIGANVTIDRGAGPDTVIGRGVIIDNLVQIAHNVVVGDGCVIVAQVGISGSTELGRGVVLAGQVGVAGHLNIGDGATVTAQSGVMHDILPGAVMFGSPAIPKAEAIRQLIWLKKNSARGKK
jgi:UDP-3-O-[3-hydroxymyristoyl] glucosamine N-acyltransferase